jgi:hypothetical protein
MSHPKETRARARSEASDQLGASSIAAHEWDLDTDVMPPEYCRQLLEISRQLQQRK